MGNFEIFSQWERIVVTAKAKAAIRRFVRNQKRLQFIGWGKSLIQNLYKEHIKGSESFTATPFRDYKALAMHKACFGGVWGKGQLFLCCCCC